MCSAETLAKDVSDDLVRLVVRVFDLVRGKVAEFGGDWVGASPVSVFGCDGADEHGY